MGKLMRCEHCNGIVNPTYPSRMRCSCPEPRVLFKPAGPRSSKLACVICGRRGYPGGRWQEVCRRGHAECRNGCGKLMGLLVDGSPRRHPSHRCPAKNPAIKAA